MKGKLLVLLLLATLVLAGALTGCGRDVPEKTIAVWQSSACFLTCDNVF